MGVTVVKSLTRADFFDFNLKYLKLAGLWPDENWSKPALYVYKIYEMTLSILSVLFLAVTAVGTYQRRNDGLALFLECLDKPLVAYNSFFKTVFFLAKRNRLRILTDEIVHSGDTISEERKKLLAKHVVFVTISCLTVAGFFSAVAQSKGEMVTEAWLPFDALKSKTSLALASQILVVAVTPCLIRGFAMQGIVCGLIVYLCDQLVELQQRLRALTYSRENDKKARCEFKDIVKKHIRLMWYSKSMNEIFKEYFLIQNFAVTIEICVNAVLLSVVKEKGNLVSLAAYLCLALLNAYIFCYWGNELILQSQNIALAAYEAPWTTWPVDLQRNLLILISVAQRPFGLSAGGFATMCIETFTQAIYNGYSIFAVLNDVVD